MLTRRGMAGVSFDGQWFCSTPCLEDAVRLRLQGAGSAEPGPLPTGLSRFRSRIGATLAHLGVLGRDDLRRVLETQRDSGERFGAAAVRLGLVSETDVLRALAVQEGVIYVAAIDLTAVVLAPGSLSPATIRALGLVPFIADAKERRLDVACAAPVPRLAVAAMARITGWKVVPFLVTDRLFREMSSAYQAGPAARGAEVIGVTDAVRRISRAATGGDASRIAHARCDRHVWVRLEGRSGAEDFLLPLGSLQEKKPCQAAHTSH